MSCIYTNVTAGKITYTSKFSKDVSGHIVKMLWPGEEGYPGDNSTTLWSPDNGERWLPKQPIAVVADKDGQEVWFNWATWWADSESTEEESPRTMWSCPEVNQAMNGAAIHLYRDENGHQHLELI